MFRTVTNERALSCTYRAIFVNYRLRFEFRHRLTELAAAISFLLLAMIFFAATAKAVEATGRDDSLSALRDYVQLIDSGAKPARSPDQDSKNVDQNQTVDAAYAALRAFAERIGVDQPTSDRRSAETCRGRQSARLSAWAEFSREAFCDAERVANGQGSGRGRNEAKHSRRSHLCRRKGLRDLPCEPDRSVQSHAHGPHRQDAKGQVRLRKLSRPRLGAREGRRRARCGRNYFVPA